MHLICRSFKFKTTAIGVDYKGGYYITSSDKTALHFQLIWTGNEGVNIVDGIIHVEETIMNNVTEI